MNVPDLRHRPNLSRSSSVYTNLATLGGEVIRNIVVKFDTINPVMFGSRKPFSNLKLTFDTITYESAGLRWDRTHLQTLLLPTSSTPGSRANAFPMRGPQVPGQIRAGGRANKGPWPHLATP